MRALIPTHTPFLSSKRGVKKHDQTVNSVVQQGPSPFQPVYPQNPMSLTLPLHFLFHVHSEPFTFMMSQVPGVRTTISNHVFFYHSTTGTHQAIPEKWKTRGSDLYFYTDKHDLSIAQASTEQEKKLVMWWCAHGEVIRLTLMLSFHVWLARIYVQKCEPLSVHLSSRIVQSSFPTKPVVIYGSLTSELSDLNCHDQSNVFNMLLSRWQGQQLVSLGTKRGQETRIHETVVKTE